MEDVNLITYFGIKLSSLEVILLCKKRLNSIIYRMLSESLLDLNQSFSQGVFSLEFARNLATLPGVWEIPLNIKYY